MVAQDLSFFHLSKKEGLSDNHITGVVTDKNGLLWVGTMEGLNCYDGYKVKRFYKEDYPALQNNNILRLECDDKNRLWIQFADRQITMLDENRQFHSIEVTDEGEKVRISYLLPHSSRGILFLSGSKLYAPDEDNPLTIKRIPWQEDEVLNKFYQRINIWDKDHIVFSGSDRLILLDVNQLKITCHVKIPGILAAVKVNDDEALATTLNTDKFCRVSLSQNKIVKYYGDIKDQYGDVLHIYPRSIYRLRGNQFILTSAYAGVYMFDALNEKLVRHKHDPANNRSVSANNTTFLFSDSSGYFFISSNTTGLNYFNINHYLASWQPAFRDEKSGKIFDGYISAITQDKKGNLWLGTQSNLIEWNRTNNRANFRPYGKVNGQTLSGTEEVRALYFDKYNRLWVGLNRFGIVIMNENHQPVKYLNTFENTLSGNLIYDIKEAPDGNIWVSTASGLNIVNPDNLQVIPPGNNAYYKHLSKVYCHVTWFRTPTEAWVGTAEGVFKIDLLTQSWKQISTEDGLADHVIYCIAEDIEHNIYIGSRGGLNILKDDQVIHTYNRSNGLRSNRCEGLLKDNNGRIWVSNGNSLLCFNIYSQRFVVFDEGVGLTDAGYRPYSYYKADNGELFWGGDKGVAYYYPDRLRQLQLPLQVNIHTVTTADTTYWLNQSRVLEMPWSKNNISFDFSAIDLFSSGNIIYRYKLEGADGDWKTTTSQREVLYSRLSPGQYTFRVMASKDGQVWKEANNSIRFTITTPWWRSGWFIILSALLLIAIVAYISYTRNKKIQQQLEQIETEQAINYFASSIYEQTSAENILWDIARNCIGRLNFEDCVIYLEDETGNKLVQKAAWGPKTTDDNKIINPLEIPLGKGIVGFVAETGKAEIIADTSKDPRYIVDDTRRSSEITVPIMYNGEVLGIIDSEHSRKNFFTQKHLSILTAIASLCANKIARVKAEEAIQKANLEMLEHQRKSVEAQLKSLRLQMSPHFLFNSLNSIQQLILTRDDTTATLYLSKFSRLLRLVLSHSDKEKVTLNEELETLSLYIELESLRFKDSFQYEIICDNSVDKDETRIPTLLIQPFVENAIWHGLLHKEGLRSLKVKFTEDTFENLVCIVEDNGIGREAAKNIHRQNPGGKGIPVAEERIKTYNAQHAVKSRVYIHDLKDHRGIPAGTRVIVTLPLLN